MNSDKLINAIKSSGAKIMNEDNFLNGDVGEFCRTLEVNCLTNDIKIEWWVNLSKVLINGIEILFDDIEVNGCWPNRAKTNIVLTKEGVMVAIIPTEDYPCTTY